MLSKIVFQIEVALKRGDFQKAIELMRRWLSTCEPGEPEQLLQNSSPQMRPNVTLLMRDLLSRYPNTLVGCPLLVYCLPGRNLDSLVSTQGMALPLPRPNNSKPCSDVQFIGWLPCDTQLPVSLPFQSERYETGMMWRTPTAVVALFRTHLGVLDLNEIVVPPMWWGEVFVQHNRSRQVANFRIEGDVLLDYPSAIEVARAMQAGARGERIPAVGRFQRDLHWAYEKGVVFLENSRIQF